jgi:hypothetical protein
VSPAVPDSEVRMGHMHQLCAVQPVFEPQCLWPPPRVVSCCSVGSPPAAKLSSPGETACAGAMGKAIADAAMTIIRCE